MKSLNFGKKFILDLEPNLVFACLLFGGDRVKGFPLSNRLSAAVAFDHDTDEVKKK